MRYRRVNQGQVHRRKLEKTRFSSRYGIERPMGAIFLLSQYFRKSWVISALSR